jgi:glycosyltransferase involved in cell wall biosynthesis
MKDGLVMHVAAPPGGGVDRYVRDLARASAVRHALWHASPSADVLEMPCGGMPWPLAHDQLDAAASELRAWLKRAGVGLLHVHSMARSVRARASFLAEALGAPMVATLHDVLFLDAAGFDTHGALRLDAAWLAEVRQFVARCAAVVAPSHYIAGLATAHLPGANVEVVPNGIRLDAPAARRDPRESFRAHRPRHVVAVVGAIGPHKGSALVTELAAALEGSDIALVVIGYLDAQVQPGWRGAHLFVHGPFTEGETGAWLDAYGARLVIFPNRVPESFSYALSEAWAARRAVIVPDQGALAERVKARGGGWIVPAQAGAATYAELIRKLLAPDADAEIARVQSLIAPDDAARIPGLAAMTRSLDALYRRFGIDPESPPDPTAAPARALLATNLDASLFRAELARLADERVQLEASIAEVSSRAARHDDESRAWIAKLEADLAQVQAKLAAEFEQRQALEQARAELAQEHARLRAAFDRLPRFVQDHLLKRASDGRA